jgi:hypothetical protein
VVIAVLTGAHEGVWGDAFIDVGVDPWGAGNDLVGLEDGRLCEVRTGND